jgi:hypothetical protein
MQFIPGVGSAGGLMSLLFVPYFLVLGVVYFFLAFFTFRFGNKIRSFVHSGETKELEDAFKSNKNLWTFLGILAIIVLAFMGLLLLGGVIGAIAAISLS